MVGPQSIPAGLDVTVPVPRTATDDHFRRLPPFLVRDSGRNSGLMMAHVTAAALCAAGVVDSIEAGLPKARAAIDSGAARAKLDAFVRFTQQFSR